MRRISLLVRLGAVLLLALAALLLGIDAGEYPGLSRAGLRALAQGALPLLVAGAINLQALRAGRIWRWCAITVNILLLAVALNHVRRGSPPFFWMLLGAACLLVLGSAGLIAVGARRVRSDGQ